MLWAYRLFLTAIILLASLIGPVLLSSNVVGMSWLILLMTSGAGLLFSLFVLWVYFLPSRRKTRRLEFIYMAVVACLALPESLAALYAFVIEVIDLVADRGSGADFGLLVALLVLILVPPYALWAYFVQPMGIATWFVQARVISAQWISGSLFVALLLLLRTTTYRVIVGQ